MTLKMIRSLSFRDLICKINISAEKILRFYSLKKTFFKILQNHLAYLLMEFVKVTMSRKVLKFKLSRKKFIVVSLFIKNHNKSLVN